MQFRAILEKHEEGVLVRIPQEIMEEGNLDSGAAILYEIRRV